MFISPSLRHEIKLKSVFNHLFIINNFNKSRYTSIKQVDPTPWVENLGKENGVTFENGNFKNISMGQGQEKPAEAVVQSFAKNGGWVMLQNCHLMQSWVPTLERLLEVVQENAHPDFRCFISAEPPPVASFKNMPESLMQGSVKVANEAPSDIKSNITRGWANFSHDRIENCTKKDDFKACLFSLCWFHSIVLGRRRFGQQGWSRKYSFNTGDLTICANVLQTYIEANPIVPWDDIRYIFGMHALSRFFSLLALESFVFPCSLNSTSLLCSTLLTLCCITNVMDRLRILWW